MPDDGAFWFGLIVRVALVVIAGANLVYATNAYRHYRDARSLRGLVDATSMLGGALVTASVAPAIWDTLPSDITPLRVTAAAGLTMFLAGMLFVLLSWRWR